MVRDVDAETAIQYLVEHDEQMVELTSLDLPIDPREIVSAMIGMLRDGRLVGGIDDDGRVWLRLPDGHWPRGEGLADRPYDDDSAGTDNHNRRV